MPFREKSPGPATRLLAQHVAGRDAAISRPFSNVSVTSSGSQAASEKCERYTEPLPEPDYPLVPARQISEKAPCAPVQPREPNGANLSALRSRRKAYGLSPVATENEVGADVKQLFSSWRWHVIGPSDGVASPKSDSLPPSLTDVPEESKGLLVMTALASQQRACQVIEEAFGKYPSLPVIVMIVDVPKSSAMVEMLLEAQLAFESAGADDVIAKPESCSVQDLRLLTMMGIQRAERRSKDLAVMRKHLRREQRQEEERRTQEAQQRQELQTQDKMFWRCVHRLLPGFPKIDPGAPCPVPGVDEDGEGRVPKLGEGAFGSVHLMETSHAGDMQAVKIIHKGKVKDVPLVCNIWREISLLRKLSHPGIVRLLGESHTRDHICIYMEAAGRRNFQEAIASCGGKLEMPDVWSVSMQLASGLQHCHNLGIAHRDVKHENVVVRSSPSSNPEKSGGRSDWYVILVDFGLAVEVGSVSGDVLWGTMPFCAPEVLLQSEPANGAAVDDPRAADVWALGVMTLEMAYGLWMMCQLLHWPRLLEPERLRGEQLRDFFGDGIETLRESLPTEVGSPQEWAYRRLLALLHGQLQVDPTARWKMNRVEAFIDSQIQATAAAVSSHAAGSSSGSGGSVDPQTYTSDPVTHEASSAGGGQRIDKRFFASDPGTTTPRAGSTSGATASHLVHPLRKKSAIVNLVKEGLRW